jgi:hypothetical protein
VINGVILADTTPDDWPKIRAAIVARIQRYLGHPACAVDSHVRYEELERYERFGLTHVRLRYHVIADEWNEAVCVLPEGCGAQQPAAGVLTIHGTNGAAGKYGMLDPEGLPARAYGIELARRGYVTLSVDQYGFGAGLGNASFDEKVQELFSRHPEWSLDGRRLLEQQRALDVFAQFPFVKVGGYGTMGNSLGGRAVIFLAAFDERITTAVCSTGISPNLSNVFRNITRDRHLMPLMSRENEQNGVMPWDYHELIALCAPRALLLLEPFNDSCNPDTLATYTCIHQASRVYRLLDASERLSTLVHGEGHDTPPDIREFSYRWFDRFLRLKVPAMVG